jgi:hypothetical protein
MIKKWISINCSLIVITVLFGWYVCNSIDEFNRRNNLASIEQMQTNKPTATPDKTLPVPDPPKIYNPSGFSIVAEKTIFSENRSNVTEKPSNTPQTPAKAAPPLTQKPILIGTIISESRKIALIVDPTASQANQGQAQTIRQRDSQRQELDSRQRNTREPAQSYRQDSTQGRTQPVAQRSNPSAAQNTNRRAQIKRIGDLYQGYTITNIAAEYIVLENGSQKEIIPLHEGSKRAASGKTAIKATQVVSIGKGAGVAASWTTFVGGTGSQPKSKIQDNTQKTPTRQGMPSPKT